MQAFSTLYDDRINAYNVLFDFTIKEYLAAVRAVVSKNPFQRKRVPSSKSIYSLLKQDIIKGCVLPSLVLALTHQPQSGHLSDGEALRLVTDFSDDLLILDGLQRTYSLLDLEKELRGPELERFLGLHLRVEVYIGLDRLGILYRMLTLNTGQTPMSLRQQIEMLYLDYLDSEINGIRFVREVDEQHATYLFEFNFRDTIEGFNSYLDRNELPIEREQLIDNIKSLESLSHEDSSKDLFEDFVLAWKALVESVARCCEMQVLTQEDADGEDISWGKSAPQVFKKAQVMTGFGSALGKLKDFHLLSDLKSIEGLSHQLTLGDVNPREFLLGLNETMSWIKTNAKKIGSAQRLFFQFYFRELFNPESDSYLNLNSSVATAQHKLQTQLL